MKSIILPQAIKNILPALGNELIVLLKETAIVGTIAVTDVTQTASLIPVSYTHLKGVARVPAACDIGGGDKREHLIIQAEFVAAEALAQIGI